MARFNYKFLTYNINAGKAKYSLDKNATKDLEQAHISFS